MRGFLVRTTACMYYKGLLLFPMTLMGAGGHLRDEEAFSGCRFRPLLPSRQVATLLGAIVPQSKQSAFVRDQMADTCPLLRLCGHNVDTKGGHRWTLEGKQRDTGAG